MNLATLLMILLASLCSALLYVILKYFERFKVYNLHGLTANYITASALSYLNYAAGPMAGKSDPTDFILYALLIGVLFISVFYIAALTAQKSGVAVTSIAGKMSMVIPIIAGLWLYHEQLDMLKSAGILLALVAVYLSSKKENAASGATETGSSAFWIYPVLLFIGSGLVDTSIKISEHFFITDENKPLYLAFLFGSAGLIGILVSLYQRFSKMQKRISARSIAGGVILGIVNYYSLEYLIIVLETPGVSSALAFAIVNVMVVLFSSLFAVLLFREKLSKGNLTGLIIAIASIVLLSA